MRNLFFLLVLVLASNSAYAFDSQALWKEAAEFYDQGNYKAAIEDYGRLLDRGMESPALYYNLGNSYFKSGDLGHAIWGFRRAILLDPGFKPAKANLDYVRTFNTDQIAVKRRGFILDIWDFLSGMLSANGYLVLTALAWWIAAALIVYQVIRMNGATWPYYLLIVPLVIIIFSAGSAGRRIHEDRLTRWGVLGIETADIREGPGGEFNRVEVAHEGLEFKILGSRENSYLIQLGNGLTGWVDKEAVLEI